VADVDVLGPMTRRRLWTAEEKAALLAEVDAEGGRVRLVARRRQISESLLYNWRSARKAAAVAMGAQEPLTFLPIGVIGKRRGRALAAPDAPTAPQPSPSDDTKVWASRSGTIEIALANGVRLSVDASVNERALSRVLRAMQGSS
jgi:transposase